MMDDNRPMADCEKTSRLIGFADVLPMISSPLHNGIVKPKNSGESEVCYVFLSSYRRQASRKLIYQATAESNLRPLEYLKFESINFFAFTHFHQRNTIKKQAQANTQTDVTKYSSHTEKRHFKKEQIENSDVLVSTICLLVLRQKRSDLFIKRNTKYTIMNTSDSVNFDASDVICLKKNWRRMLSDKRLAQRDQEL